MVISYWKAQPPHRMGEAVSSPAKITEEISGKYDLIRWMAVPKMKSIIKENIEQQTPIEIEDAELLFAEKPLARDDFREELRKQGVEKPIEVEYVKPARSDKVQKIKTDGNRNHYSGGLYEFP